VKDKETGKKVEKEVNFFTQGGFNSERIIDRIYISHNIKLKVNVDQVIEKKFCSDHVILSAYIE
jgi:hypothetical protein